MTEHQKLRSFILILSFILFFSPAFSQSNHYDYSSTDKKRVYTEDFGASSFYWDTDEPGRRSAKVENGDLIFRSLNDKTQVKYKTIDVDWEKDWELELKVKWIRGKENSAIDLIWDKEPGNSNKFHFGFTANRKYVLAEYKNESYDHILEFISSTTVNKSSYNTLTVRKVGSIYYLFFNTKLIKSMPYKAIKGDMIGFTVPPNSTISVDHLYAFQLEKPQSTNTVASLNNGNKGSYNNYSENDMTTVYREDFNDPNSKWEVYSSGVRMGKIHNGVLDWISMNDNAQMIWHILDDMNWSRDWQIEARVKFVTGKENSSNDLVWNINENSSDKYHFGFTGQGKYVFSKKVGSEYQTILPFTESEIVKKGLFNKITIRKKDDSYSYFFNEKLLTTKSYHTVNSDKVGFMVAPNTTIQIDYLDVSYLKPKQNNMVSTLPSGANYVGIMTKYNGYNLQRWKTRDMFPKDEIKSDWNDGYSVSDLSYDNDKWSLITSKGTGYSTQTWITRNEWPKDEIKEKWNESYRITEANYGNGVWAIVFSKGSSLGRQRWSTRSDFPTEKIKEFGDDGLWITELIYGKDRWALIASTDPSIRGQKWSKSVDFPESKIKQNQSEGYVVTQLSYENNLWILVMSKYANSQPQKLVTSSAFPKADIKEYWGQGYYLTDITFGTTNVENSFTSNRVETTDLKSNVSELLVGKWYGGGVNDNEGEKGYMIFDSERYTTMVSNGDTIGGKGWVTDGVSLDLKFQIINSTSPQGIDLVFQSEGQNFGTMKGIIRMIDEDTFEFCLASDMTEPRPIAFEDKNDIKVAVFKRVN